MAPKHAYEAEYGEALNRHMPTLSKLNPLPIGDIKSRREGGNMLFYEALVPAWPSTDLEKVARETVHIETKDGYSLPIHHFFSIANSTGGSSPTAAIFYVHGGGFFGLSTDHYEKVLKTYVLQSGLPLISVDMRLAPEHPFPMPVDDSYEALLWLGSNAASLNVDPARIAILGDSAGGGLAAGVAIKARDEGLSPPLAKQMLLGACLDDRAMHKRYPKFEGLLTWTTDDSITGWQAYLGADNAGDTNANVSPYGAPARVKAVDGLPPLYLEVPGIDILLDENLTYASRIAAAGIPTEIHVWPGVPHSFELFAPEIGTARVAMARRIKAMKAL